MRSGEGEAEAGERSARVRAVMRHLNPFRTLSRPPAGSAEESALRAELQAAAPRLGLIQQLCAAMTAQGEPIPLDSQEASLRLLLQAEPNRLDLVQRLCTVIAEQGKPVPWDLEEACVRAQLEGAPDRADLLQRLCTAVAEQGRPVPLDMEERTLLAHLRTQPDRADLEARLEVVQRRLGKLPVERENELRLAELRDRDFSPTNLYVQITNHCNLRCVMCGHKTAEKDNAFMDDALFMRVLEQASAQKVNNLIFAAAFGETLMHPKAVEYLKESVRRGFRVTVATNGNFLDAARIEELASLGLHCIQYSFFGFDAPSYEKTYVNGKFETARENLRLLKVALMRAGGRTQLLVNGINVVNNPERTRKTRELVASLGVREDEMRFSMPNNFAGRISPGTFSARIGAKSFKPVDELPRYICPQLLTTPGVMADGRLTACGCLDNNGSLSIGNIRTSTMAEMRSGARYQSMIRAFQTGDLSEFPLCQKCDVPYGTSNERPASD